MVLESMLFTIQVLLSRLSRTVVITLIRNACLFAAADFKGVLSDVKVGSTVSGVGGDGGIHV